jgi:SEC-C motif-containing protein
MRSRYTAYTLGDEAYLLSTWHSSTRPAQLDLGDRSQQWLRLKILHTELGLSGDDDGVVEFVAIYKVNGRAERLQERSRFIIEDGAWRYLDGMYPPTG